MILNDYTPIFGYQVQSFPKDYSVRLSPPQNHVLQGKKGANLWIRFLYIQIALLGE